jgi:homoserine O-succinyltransferase
MPIKIPIELPAFQVLSNESIFIINNERADTQDIRPLKIAILNLMPKKIVTETQLLRYLSNTPLQVEITLIQTKSYVSQNTSSEHLDKFYSYFENIKHEKFDGLIITGAPVEQMEFEDVTYWKELTEIMDWSKTNVFSTLHICWASQAGLYYRYNVPKYDLKEKIFGVFSHWVNDEKADLTRGLDDVFFAPHSRHTEVRRKDIEKIPDLEILSESEEAGVFIVETKDRRNVFITGHMEYDRNTLKDEYIRDKEKGEDVELPRNYFKNDDVKEIPQFTWRGTASIVFGNWLNYCVYQNTPFDLSNL